MPLSPTTRLFLWIAACASGLVAGARLVNSFTSDEIYNKDFIQEFVFAKSVRAGEEPYLPMAQMLSRWFEPPPRVNWAGPSPHTPVTAVLSLPVAALDYFPAALLWFILELTLFIGCWLALLRWWGNPVPWSTRVLLILFSLNLGPVFEEFYFGNLSFVLCALILAAWLSLRKNNDVRGGVFLGLAIALKLTGWPIGLWLVLKRRWSAVAASAVVVIGLHVVAAGEMGIDHVVDYYRRVGPGVARACLQHNCNFSPWTIGPRLFAEYNSAFNNFVVLAPMSSERLAGALMLALPLTVLGVGLWLAWRCRDFDTSFGILVCVSLMVNPVAWDHSLLVAAVPIALIAKRLAQANWPRPETPVALVCFVLAMLPQQAYMRGLAAAFATTDENGIRYLPFALGLVTYLPLLALVGAIWLLWKGDAGLSHKAAKSGTLIQ